MPPQALPAATSIGRQRHHDRPRIFPQLSKNLDLTVLRPENQNPTHVTPLIDQLAQGWFNERLHVVGVKPPEDHLENEAKRAKRARLWMLQRLGEYIERQMSKKKASKKTRIDSFTNDDRIVDEFWRAVVVDGVKYSVCSQHISVDLI